MKIFKRKRVGQTVLVLVLVLQWRSLIETFKSTVDDLESEENPQNDDRYASILC